MEIPRVVIDAMREATALDHNERAVYLIAWFCEPVSILDLSSAARMDRNAASRACRNLSDHGWMKLIPSGGRFRPTSVIPFECQVALAHDLEAEHAMAANRGEFLANKRLDWCLRNDEYVLNASPPFLSHPSTGDRLEYSRYHPKSRFAVDLDFHSPTTPSSYVDSPEDRVSRTNALLRAGISRVNDIIRMVFTTEDLRLGILEEKLSDIVPHLMRHYTDREGPYFQTLAVLCEQYVDEAACTTEQE